MTARRPPPPPDDVPSTPRWWSPGIRLTVGIVAVSVAWTMLFAAERGLQVRYFESAGVPMRYMVRHPAVRAELHAALHADDASVEPAESHLDEKFPGVVVVHGYSGSSALMLGYAHVLARAGFGVMLPDLPGHGANDTPLSSEGVDAAVAAAVAALADLPEIDSTRIGLLGHSMGAGAVLEAGAARPDQVAAVVAVSPVPAEITPVAPRNLQLQAGGWEPRFMEMARALLDAAGGEGNDFGAGTARDLVAVPAAEHLSILFRDGSHQAAREWFLTALGDDDMPVAEWSDRRMLWWLVYVVGLVIAVSSLAPGRLSRDAFGPRYGAGLGWIALAVAPFAATLICWVLSLGIDLASLGGVALAGALGIWFAAAGSVQLFVPFRFTRPSGRHLLRASLLFGFLWLAVGVTADLVWASWGLETPRLLLWPVLAVASVPWFVGTEALVAGRRARDRILAWLAQSVVAVAGLWLLAALVPGLGLVILLLPLVPLFLGLMSAVNARLNDPWTAGIGSALFWGWLLVSAFPIVG